MNGLELCRTYYFECAAPAIEKEFGERSKLIAAGLAGAGSDCMGYDDEISRDHDFGPGCCLWLTDRDYAEFGSDLRKLYASLPKSFAGVPRLAICTPPRKDGSRRRHRPPASRPGHHREAVTVGGRLGRGRGS